MPFRASWDQRRLADELEQLRVASAMSHRDVADATGWSSAKVSRAESAVTRITAADVRILAELYGVDAEETERLCEMARNSAVDVWWRRYERWLSPSFVDFLTYEDAAAEEWSVQAMFVPGLLQTAAYTASLFASGPAQDPDRADAEREVRRKRAARLHDSDHPLTYHAFLVESALHWQFGGSTVLREQLEHLIGMAKLPNIEIRLIPFTRATPVYSFDLLERGNDGPVVAFSETPWGAPIHEDPLEIRQLKRNLERLDALAFSTADSVQRLSQRIGEITE